MSAGGRPGDDPGRLDPLESWANRVLQMGVVISAFLVGLGVVLWVITGDAGYQLGVYPLSLGPIVAGVLAGRPIAVIQAGLVLLMLTPIFRVGAAALVFARQGDRLYTLITLAVFGVLMAMLLTGGGEG